MDVVFRYFVAKPAQYKVRCDAQHSICFLTDHVVGSFHPIPLAMKLAPPPRFVLIAATCFAFVGSEAIGQALNVTLMPSDHNGYAVSCFGGVDGEIEAIVTGGTPPYTYLWLHQDTTAVVTGLAAGFYRVEVIDADSTIKRADITLTQPRALVVTLDAYTYANGFNVSCTDCYNGSIQTTVQWGVAPYTYLWHDAATTQHRTGLGSGNHYVTATDANGCSLRPATLFLTQPADNNWDMEGNTGTDPAVHYMGTADSTDLVLKSNGVEMVRLKADGQLKLTGINGGPGPLLISEDGVLSGAGDHYDLPPLPVVPCGPLSTWPFWETDGNDFGSLCEETPRLGTTSATPLHVITADEERLIIHVDGKTELKGTTVIGPDFDVDPFATYPARLNLQEENGQWLRLYDGDGKYWRLMSVAGSEDEGESIRFHFTNGPYPPTQGLGPLALYEDGGVRAGPSLRVHANGKVSIGEVPIITPDYDYQLYVEHGILTERVKVALKTSDEWSDHVFLPGYRLMPLPEVKAFIQEHGHLPGVPSADQMVEQGLDVVKTDAMLMEKVEELMLYILELEGRLLNLEKQAAMPILGR